MEQTGNKAIAFCGLVFRLTSAKTYRFTGSGAFDALSVPDTFTVYPSLVYLPVEGVTLSWRPSATAQTLVLFQCMGLVMGKQDEIGLVSGTQESASFHLEQFGWIMAHQADHLFGREQAFIAELHHALQAELNHWHSAYGLAASAFLLAEQMWSMVGADNGYSSVKYGLSEGIAVALALFGRISHD